MLHARIPTMRNQALIGISVFVLGLWAAWKVGGKIADGDIQTLLFATLGLAACAVAVTILRNWRAGFYLFLVWLLFEDLVRKYLGNGTALFFGKDILVGLVYVSFFVALRRQKEKAFRPPFLFPLAALCVAGRSTSLQSELAKRSVRFIGLQTVLLLCSPDVRRIRRRAKRGGLAEVSGGQCLPGRDHFSVRNYSGNCRQQLLESGARWPQNWRIWETFTKRVR